MQIPSLDIRELKVGDALRDDEVEVTAAQARRVQELRDRAAELAARPGMTKAARRRRNRR